jgi:hypothetical protein
MLTEQHLRRFRIPALVALAIYFLYFYLTLLNRCLYHYAQHQGGDFFHFFAAAVAMSSGQDIYRSGTGGYVYPPLLAFLYLPLAHLSAPVAAAIVLSVNVPLMAVALLVGATLACQRLDLASDSKKEDETLSPSSRIPGLVPLVAILVAVITFGRVKAELAIMQTDVIVLAAYVLGVYWLDRRPILAGAILGFALNIKYYTLPALPYFLLRRRWNAAGGFIGSAIAFALLPALCVGLSTDLRYLAIAFGGVLKSVGVQTGQAEAARVHHVYESLSLSITSGLSRIMLHTHPALATPLTALVMLAFVVLAGWWYSRSHLPLFLWPLVATQARPPFRLLLALEWAGLMIGSIAFSPDSNLRHMVLVLFPNCLAVALLLDWRRLKSPERDAATLLAAIAIQIFALDLVGDLHIDRLTSFFFDVGGQGWCLLIFYGMLLWAGLRRCAATV